MTSRILPLFITCALFGACDSTAILSGNFDQTPYPAVSGSIPGAPDGDSITLQEVDLGTGPFVPGAAAANQFWFRDTACATSTASCVSPGRLGYFMARPLATSERGHAITLNLEGNAFFAPATTMVLDLFSGHFAIVGSIRYATTGTTITLTAKTGGGDVLLGTMATGEHYTLVLRALPTQGLWSLVITPTNGPVISREGLATLGPIASDDLGVALHFTNPRTTNSTFRLDRLSMYVAKE